MGAFGSKPRGQLEQEQQELLTPEQRAAAAQADAETVAVPVDRAVMDLVVLDKRITATLNRRQRIVPDVINQIALYFERIEDLLAFWTTCYAFNYGANHFGDEKNKALLTTIARKLLNEIPKIRLEELNNGDVVLRVRVPQTADTFYQQQTFTESQFRAAKESIKNLGGVEGAVQSILRKGLAGEPVINVFLEKLISTIKIFGDREIDRTTLITLTSSETRMTVACAFISSLIAIGLGVAVPKVDSSAGGLILLAFSIIAALVALTACVVATIAYRPKSSYYNIESANVTTRMFEKLQDSKPSDDATSSRSPSPKN